MTPAQATAERRVAAMPTHPTRRAIDARLRRLEAEYDLLDYQVDGWCVWPLVRFVVDTAHYGGRPSAKRHALGPWRQLTFAVRDLPALARLRRAHLAVVAYASNRSETRDGRFQDVFFDPLLAELGSYCKIEHLDNVGFLAQRRRAFIPADVTTTTFNLSASTLARFGMPRAVAETAAELHAALQAGLGAAPLTVAQLATLLWRFVWLKRGYGHLLRRIRPRHLLLVTAYGDHALVAAAKEQGIEVIELQHGALDRTHSGYSWSADALPYKARLPIPDRLFLYGRYWADELAANGFWGEALRVVGSLRLDAYRQRRAAPTGDSVTLVLTTQGWDVERVVTFMHEFLDLARGELPLRLVVKLHPGEASKDQYCAAFGAYSNVTVLLNGEPLSTFELISRANVHLSISSTCHFEALGLGVPTVILPFQTHEMVTHLCATGYAVLAPSPAELLAAVRHWRHEQVPDEVGRHYFELNALQNMKRELGYGDPYA